MENYVSFGFMDLFVTGERTDQVHLVAKYPDSSWVVCHDVTITQNNKNKDVVYFDMSHPVDK